MATRADDANSKVLGRDPFARAEAEDEGTKAEPGRPAPNGVKHVGGKKRITQARPAEEAAPERKKSRPLPPPEARPVPPAVEPAPLPAAREGVEDADAFDAFGFNAAYLKKADNILEFLYAKYFRTRVRGVANVPADGGAILVSNHSGAIPLDWLMLIKAVRAETPGRRKLRPLVEDALFHFPFLNLFISRVGGVRACQENAERLLKMGELVAVFPEGEKGISKPFSRRYRLQRFGRGGFMKLALRTRTPVIPVAVIGSEESFPLVTTARWLASYLGVAYFPVTPTFPILGPFGLIPLPSKWLIIFGEPMEFECDPAAEEDPAMVNRLAEKVKDTIQLMINDGLAERKSAFF